MATLLTCWLKNNNGEKIAPKTLASQVQMSDGTFLEDKINNILIKETDPTIPDWAKEPHKPSYTANEIDGIQQMIQNQINDIILDGKW